MADQTTLTSKFATEMSEEILASLEDAKTVTAGLVGMGGEDPLPAWFRANYPDLFENVGTKQPQVQHDEPTPESDPEPRNLDQRVVSKSGLSVAKKIVKAVNSEPDRWWDYDEIMSYWADRDDPIPAKARIRTAVSNWKKQGTKNTKIEIAAGGQVRAYRAPTQQPARVIRQTLAPSPVDRRIFLAHGGGEL